MERGTRSRSGRKALCSSSVEEGASSKGDLMMRRVPKDAATERKSGKSRRVKNPSTKSTKKAAAATFEAKKRAAAGPTAAAEAGKEGEVKNPAAAAVPAVAVESDTTGKEGGLRLPQKVVDFILSFTPEVIVDPDEYYARRINDPSFSREYVESSTKNFREMAEQSKRVADMLVDYKAWMRAQLEEKGYVEVDEDYIAQRIRQSMELEEDDEYPEAFEPMEGLIADDTPQSVIDEIDGRISMPSA